MAEDVSTQTERQTSSEAENEPILSDGYIIDCITGEKPLKETPKEQVRQFIAQALKNQYHIEYDDMQADFVVGSGKNRKVIDIAIFHPGRDHTVLNLSRAVICRPMPTMGRNATRLRDPHEAEKDLNILREIMTQSAPLQTSACAGQATARRPPLPVEELSPGYREDHTSRRMPPSYRAAR